MVYTVFYNACYLDAINVTKVISASDHNLIGIPQKWTPLDM